MRPRIRAPRDILAQTSRGSPVSLRRSPRNAVILQGTTPVSACCPRALHWSSSALSPTVTTAQKGKPPGPHPNTGTQDHITPST